MSDPRPWLGIVVALPALVAAMSNVHADVERLRRIAVISAAVMLAAAFIIAMSPQMHAFAVRTEALTAVAGGEAVLRVDRTSDVLLPFAAAMWLLTVAVTPRASLDRGGLRRTAIATLLNVASFLSESAVLLLVLSALAVWTFLSALADPAHRYQRRIV